MVKLIWRLLGLFSFLKGLVLFGAGLIFILIAIFNEYFIYHTKQTSEKIMAQVIDNKVHHLNNATTYQPLLRYRRGNNTFEFEGIGSSKKHEIGTKLPVYIKDSDSSFQMMATDLNARHISTFFILSISVLLCFAGLFFMRKKKIERALRDAIQESLAS